MKTNKIKKTIITMLMAIMVTSVTTQAAVIKEEYEYTVPNDKHYGSLGDLVRVTKTSSTKQDVKKVKMSRASKKTYTKTLPVRKTSSICCEKPEEWRTVETIYAVTYHTTEFYNKGSKIKTVKTIKETVVTKKVTDEPYVCCPPIPFPPFSPAN